MTNRKRFKAFKVLSLVGVIWGVIKYTYFSIKGGLHLKPINSAEEICTSIMWLIWGLAMYFFFAIVYDMVKLFANAEPVYIPGEMGRIDTGMRYYRKKLTKQKPDKHEMDK
ncbi:MAG: hypothetical protein PHT07_21550 [Paludibacter sp.]|nr:hypothetical protein [Paludibacter sp.]